mmetsp:Transcript_6975/g.18944  ORF Transcript_6975/g.18944 Transcript_6975/m.18944 type:complete len:384 (-) Transcript_6975:314-1465(-)
MIAAHSAITVATVVHMRPPPAVQILLMLAHILIDLVKQLERFDRCQRIHGRFQCPSRHVSAGIGMRHQRYLRLGRIRRMPGDEIDAAQRVCSAGLVIAFLVASGKIRVVAGLIDDDLRAILHPTVMTVRDEIPRFQEQNLRRLTPAHLGIGRNVLHVFEFFDQIVVFRVRRLLRQIRANILQRRVYRREAFDAGILRVVVAIRKLLSRIFHPLHVGSRTTRFIERPSHHLVARNLLPTIRLGQYLGTPRLDFGSDQFKLSLLLRGVGLLRSRRRHFIGIGQQLATLWNRVLFQIIHVTLQLLHLRSQAPQFLQRFGHGVRDGRPSSPEWTGWCSIVGLRRSRGGQVLFWYAVVRAISIQKSQSHGHSFHWTDHRVRLFLFGCT